MKFKILFLLFIIPVTCFSQTDKYVFFGIDLNLDWYSLTNQTAFTYSNLNDDKSSMFNIIDCGYISDKIEKRFLNLGFQELLLIFQKDFKGNLKDLKPDVFLARITYSSLNEYTTKSKNDIEKSIALLNGEFGVPELNMIKNGTSTYKWRGVYYQIYLTSRADELTTTLIYSKE